MNNYSQIKECPITNNTEHLQYFSLGNIPLVNNLNNTREESLNAERFPLNVNYHLHSGLSSLDIAVNGDLLFSNYLFKSEVNIPYIEHCKNMFGFIKNYISLEENSKFIDIGGNDGTLLKTFESQTDKNLWLLNIDPSENLSKLSIDKGIPTLTKFFNLEVAQSITENVDVVTSTNVFQHLKDLNSFAEGIRYILSNNGVWALEFPYWINSMETNQFDQIYHEHMYYHSVTPLKALIEKHKMKIINVTKHDIHGGTLRLIIAREESSLKPDITVEEYLKLETNYDLNYHIKWGEQIQTHIAASKYFIKELKSHNKTIYGFGAAAKGCIYLNTMGLTYNDIDYIIDDTDIKQNKFVPGTGIQIISRDILKDKQPDYILVLAHNFKDYIMSSLREFGYKGKFIILVPKIQTYE